MKKKRSSVNCQLCEADLVANEDRTDCETPADHPNAAIAELVSIEAASSDAKFLTLNYRLSVASPRNRERTATRLIEPNDRLEVQIATRTDFKTGVRQLILDLPASTPGDENSLLYSFVVEPSNKTMRDDMRTELTPLGSAWSQLRYFRVRVMKPPKPMSNDKIGYGPVSTRNDAWSISSKCSDKLYLRTHPDDDLLQPPLSILTAAKEANVPSCQPCPEGANW